MAAAVPRSASATPLQLLGLPRDALGLVLYKLTLAHDIAAVAPTCRQLCDAAKIALKLRPFSGEVVTLAEHGNCVTGVVVATDGSVVTGSWDMTIKVWRDGACERTTQPHDRIDEVKLLPNGAELVSLHKGTRTATFWTSTCSLSSTVNIQHERPQFPQCIAVLHNGTHFVVGYHGDVKLFERDGTLVRTIEGHSRHVVSLAAMHGQRFLSGSDDHMIKLWDLHSENSLIAWNAGGCIYALAVTPDGQRILSGDISGTVQVWLFEEGPHTIGVSRENTFSKLHANYCVRVLVALPDNKHALSGSQDGTVKLFVVDGDVLRTFTHHTTSSVPNAVISLALLPDGLRFVSGSVDRTARIAYHGLAPIRI